MGGLTQSKGRRSTPQYHPLKYVCTHALGLVCYNEEGRSTFTEHKQVLS